MMMRKIAHGVVGSLKAQPLALALVVVVALFLVVFALYARSVSQDLDAERTLLGELLKGCVNK